MAAVIASLGFQSTLSVLTNAGGQPINVGASSSFVPWNSMQLSDGWTVRLAGESNITQWVPVEWTATQLEHFYQTIFLSASTNFWSATSPSPSSAFSLRIGGLNLFFSPLFTSASLPWHVIAQFAWAMLDAARRGYTAGYSLRMQSPADSQGGSNSGWMVILLAGPAPVPTNTSPPLNREETESASDDEPPCKRQCPSGGPEPP